MDSSSQTDPTSVVALEQYHENVRELAMWMRRRRRLTIPLEDLVSAGLSALYDREKHKHHEYDSARGTFWAFVRPGIWGAMVSEVEFFHGVSRKAHAYARAQETASASALSADDKPTDLELIRDIQTIAENTRIAYRLMMQAPPPRPAPPDTPEEDATASETRQRLEAAVESLPARNGELIRLRFHDELSLLEIGKRHGISESRVGHKLREALNALRASLDSNGA